MPAHQIIKYSLCAFQKASRLLARQLRVSEISQNPNAYVRKYFAGAELARQHQELVQMREREVYFAGAGAGVSTPRTNSRRETYIIFASAASIKN
jgi:hypothetical protein